MFGARALSGVCWFYLNLGRDLHSPENIITRGTDKVLVAFEVCGIIKSASDKTKASEDLYTSYA